MDNHPIPQDVTNFQFKLIGEMTLKQFCFVAAGVLLAWIMLASPLPLIIKMFLAGICVGFGVILAFVPIEGRPSDVMLLYFIKALFNPTQYIYQKFSGQQPVIQPTQTVMHNPLPKEENKPEEKKEKEATVSLQSLPQVAIPALEAHQKETKPEQPLKSQEEMTAPAINDVNQTSVLIQQVAAISNELSQAKNAEEHQKKGSEEATLAHEKVLDLEKELQQVVQQKQMLEQQLINLQKTINEKKQQVFTPSDVKAPTTQQTQHVRKVPKQMSASVGVPLVPDVPNLITGVIKDPRGNILTNILIEVKDKDGNPVRAFKTNPLGQFASATPLLNGTYTVSFEDPQGKNEFDAVEIVAEGKVLLPLEIISVDAREKLRQELFG